MIVETGGGPGVGVVAHAIQVDAPAHGVGVRQLEVPLARHLEVLLAHLHKTHGPSTYDCWALLFRVTREDSLFISVSSNHFHILFTFCFFSLFVSVSYFLNLKQE